MYYFNFLLSIFETALQASLNFYDWRRKLRLKLARMIPATGLAKSNTAKQKKKRYEKSGMPEQQLNAKLEGLE